MEYDIWDYKYIHEPYGTPNNYGKSIKKQLHGQFDLVVYHIYDEHEWFEESRSSRDLSKKGWNICRLCKV